jgi:hypothetical protein
MPAHVTLIGTSREDIFRWLPDFIQLARHEQLLHPLRPKASMMIPYDVPIQCLYNFARDFADWYIGIYEALPENKPPFGRPLMLIAGGLPDRPDRPGEMNLGLWHDPQFPLALPEIAWALEKRFPSVDAPESPLKPFAHPIRPNWSNLARQPHTRIQHGVQPMSETGLNSAPSYTDDSPPASRRTRPLTGAPPLSCNVWLEDQISNLENPDDYGHLYEKWLEMYIDLRGEPPADRKRSFRRAAEAIRDRQRQRRQG